MAYVHVAHDVRIGSHTILANGVTIGGHVTRRGLGRDRRVQRRAPVLPRRPACHDRRLQRGHAGRAAVFDDRQRAPHQGVFGANKTGLERRGFSAATIDGLQKAFRLLTRSGLNTTQAIERIRAEVPPCAGDRRD